MDNAEIDAMLSSLPTSYRKVFAEAELEYRENGVFFLESAYITALNNDLGLFPRIIDVLLAEAEALRKDAVCATSCLFVYRSMIDRERFLADIDLFTSPEKYSFFFLFCMLPFMRDIHARLKSINIPADVIHATLSQFEEIAFIYYKRYDKLGYNMLYFKFMQHYLDCRILNIGRLRFELTRMGEEVYLLENTYSKELQLVMGNVQVNSSGMLSDTPPLDPEYFRTEFTENKDEVQAYPVLPNGRCSMQKCCYPKNKFVIRLKPGDDCLSVHIPDRGELSESACEESYRYARDIFRNCYPDIDVKAFVCYSWMMSPQLSDMLRNGSHILCFNRKYMKFPIPTKGRDALNFVFNLKYTSFDTLPEETSLQRSIKKLYTSGKLFYEFGGVFLNETAQI